MAYFVFSDGRNTFAVQLLDPAMIGHARGLIDGSIIDGAHIGGIVTVGPADYNVGWSYHITPDNVSFYDMSAEIGDAPIFDVEEFVQSGRPVEEYLPHNSWTSWATYVLRELHEVTGTGTADILRGTRAADIIFGHEGNDRLLGAEGDDFLVGGAGDDRLEGDAGDDKLGGGDGNDLLIGGSGDDVLEGGRGTDRMVGGLGNDTYVIDSLRDITIEYADGGVDLVKSPFTYTLRPYFEQLKLVGAEDINGRGNSSDNVLIGNSGDNRLWGEDGNDIMYGDGGDVRVDSGNDTLFGGSGDDRLYGGSGDDRLDGGAGEDRLYGGSGDDIYIVSDGTDYAYEFELDGDDRVYSSVSHRLRDNVERLDLTGAGDLTGIGNSQDNVIVGNDGANRLYGADGADQLAGGAGNDRVYGGAGDDRLYGGEGNDVLEGGAGRELYYGGSGSDRFVFRDGDLGGDLAQADIIHDFSQTDGDRIDLRSADANRLIGGSQDFSFIAGEAFTGTAGELRYEQIGGATFVMADTDGDATADFVIRLDGLHTLTSSDFVI